MIGESSEYGIIHRKELKMLPNLEAEIARNNIKKKAIANAIDLSERGLQKKLKGESSFTFPEAEAIRDTFFLDMDLEYLFEQS